MSEERFALTASNNALTQGKALKKTQMADDDDGGFDAHDGGDDAVDIDGESALNEMCVVCVCAACSHRPQRMPLRSRRSSTRLR